MTCRLPKSIRIGPHDIRLDELSDVDAEREYGHWMEGEMKIGLRKKFAAGSVAVESMIHEILHAVWFVAGVNEDDDEERIVHLTSKQLTQVFRDNPELIAWMQETVKK